jgi:pilus assembly protein Flp/PilA
MTAFAHVRSTRRRREVYSMELRDWYELIRIQLRREEGQTMTEYGILLALIAVAVITVLTLLGGKIANVFTRVTNSL